MIYKELSPRSGYVRVTFEIPASVWASHVYLVGDFNNWDSCASPFQQLHNGVWHITLELPAWHRYEFRYLIDGHWTTDSHADGCTEANTGNGSKTVNSFVNTTLPLESLATSVGHSMVHEAALDKGIDLVKKQEVRERHLEGK